VGFGETPEVTDQRIAGKLAGKPASGAARRSTLPSEDVTSAS